MNIGVIGSGRIADRFLQECRAAEDVACTVIYNPHIEGAKRLAKARGISFATNQWEEFTDKIEAGYIASPHASHAAYIEKLLLAGKHVLCEKPLALKREDAERLLSLAAAKGLILLEAEKTAYCPGFRKIEELVQSGRIGRVVDVEAAFSRLTFTDGREYLDAQAGGSFTEFGSYPMLPIFRFLGTEYTDLTFQAVTERNGVDSYAKASFTYPGGMGLAGTGLGVKTEGQLVISGTKGYILVPSPWWLTKKIQVRYEDPGKIEEYTLPFEGFGLRYEIRAFADAIQKGMDPKTVKSIAKETIARAEVMGRFLAWRNERKVERYPSSEEKKVSPNIWAHRGCSRYLPENTLPAFLEAARLPGICGIETDVQLTADGEVVIFHDERIDRVLQGTGNIRDLTYAELRAIPFRLKRDDPEQTEAGRAAKYASEEFYVPTLREFLEAMKPYCERNGLLLNIELKTSVVRYEGIEAKTIEQIRALGMEHFIIFSSFLPESIAITGNMAPEIPTGMLAAALEDCIEKGAPMKAGAWHPHTRHLTGSSRPEAIGKPIRAWNSEEILYHSTRKDPGIDYRAMGQLGVTDIIVNEPEKYLSEESR